MIPAEKILQRIDIDKAGSQPNELKLTELRKRLTGVPSATSAIGQETGSTPSGGIVTRLIFVSSGVFRYIVHSSILDAFLVKWSLSQPAENEEKRLPLGEVTFEHLHSDIDIHRQISRLVVFVSATATLKDVRVALERVDGAQDVIVTATGNSSEPMLGWITNSDLLRALNGS